MKKLYVLILLIAMLGAVSCEKKTGDAGDTTAPTIENFTGEAIGVILKIEGTIKDNSNLKNYKITILEKGTCNLETKFPIEKEIDGTSHTINEDISFISCFGGQSFTLTLIVTDAAGKNVTKTTEVIIP